MEAVETRSFLIGYFYSIFMLYNHPRSNKDFSRTLDLHSGQIPIFTKSIGKMTIAINRGICPIGGNVPFAFSNLPESRFDIVKSWTTSGIWEYLEFEFNPEHDEVRLTFDKLLKVIHNFGGLDLYEMEEFITYNKPTDE